MYGSTRMLIRCPHCEYARTISATKIPNTAEVATCPKCKSRFRFRTLDPDEKPVRPSPEAPKEKAPADIWEAVDALSRSLPPAAGKGQAAPDDNRGRKRDAGREAPTREPRRRRSDYPDYQSEQSGEPKRRRGDTPAPGTPKRRREDQPAPAEGPMRRREDWAPPADPAGYHHENRFSSAADPGPDPDHEASAFTDASPQPQEDHRGQDVEPRRRHDDPIELANEARRKREEQRAERRAAEQGPGLFAKGAAAAAAAVKTPLAWAIRKFTQPQAESASEPVADLPHQRHRPLEVEHAGAHPPIDVEPTAPPSAVAPAEPVEPDALIVTRMPLVPPAADPAPFEAEQAGPSWEPQEPTAPITPQAVAKPDAQEGGEEPAEREEQPLPEEPAHSPAEAEEQPVEEHQATQEAQATEEAEAAGTDEDGATETTAETEAKLPEPEAAQAPAPSVPPQAPGLPSGRATPLASSAGPAVFPYSAGDTASPEERVARDMLLLRDEGERPTRDLGHIDQWADEDNGDTGGHTDIPWENQEVHGRLGGFVATVRGMLLRPASFFAGMPAYGSLAPAYLFFIIQSYIALLCTLLWRLAVSTALNDGDLFPPTRLGLPILLLLTPLFMGLMLMFCTGVIRTFLRIMVPEQADFPAAFKVICYASSAFVFCVIPLLGPAVGWVWFATTMVCGFRNALGLSWSMAGLTALLPAVLLPGSMAALFF